MARSEERQRQDHGGPVPAGLGLQFPKLVSDHLGRSSLWGPCGGPLGD